MTGGRFIVFEGLDGAGTTTQIELLATWLRERGLELEVTREPTGGAIGRMIREALRGAIDLDAAALALLFAADRVDHLRGAGSIKALLDKGRWVLSDRYLLSSVAYQVSDGLDAEWVISLNRHAFAPDLTVFVDTDPEVCLQRIEARGGRRERYETLERQHAVRAQFRRHLGRADLTGTLITVDGNGSREEVAASIQREVEAWFESRGEPPPGRHSLGR